MEIKQELLDALSKWTDRLKDPKVKSHFVGFNKTLQFDFPDQPFHIHMAFQSDQCKLADGDVPSPDIVITATSNTILGITKGEINPLKAFLSRKLRAKGDRTQMMRVQMLMKQD